MKQGILLMRRSITKKALEKNSDLLEAQFNLGDALVKQERFDEALEAFEKVSASTEDQNLKANALHNKGNVLLSKQDLEGAIESYKDALRINIPFSEANSLASNAPSSWLSPSERINKTRFCSLPVSK
mgnify:CR=1 FL=1